MNLALLAPEITLLTFTCVVLLVDLYAPGRERVLTYACAQLALLAAAGAALATWDGPAQAFAGSYRADLAAVVIKLAALGAVSATLAYGRRYLRERAHFSGEYLTLTLFATLGVLLLASGGSLLTLYLGLETLSLSAYALVATDRDSPAGTEAAVKYFFLGALASAMLLYGMSLLYGLGGTLALADLGGALAGAPHAAVGLALVFVIVGVGFKLGAAPFHMWVPDVYHGAPTPVTMFLSTASKLGALALALRLLVDGLADYAGLWQQMAGVAAVLSLGIGNLVAIAQSNLKRMLAYSTIAHAGFFLLALLGDAPAGPAAGLFYVLVYALMSLGSFGAILLLARAGFEADRIEDFRGLNARAPWAALVVLVVMFSLAGVPPTAGFYAKLVVIQALVGAGHTALAVYAVLMSVVGAFYYLRVVKAAYFDPAPVDGPGASPAGGGVLLAANGTLIVLLGIFPGPLLALCQHAFAG
jgi:NADH-quinone oxidoreductase subunit N